MIGKPRGCTPSARSSLIISIPSSPGLQTAQKLLSTRVITDLSSTTSREREREIASRHREMQSSILASFARAIAHDWQPRVDPILLTFGVFSHASVAHLDQFKDGVLLLF